MRLGLLILIALTALIGKAVAQDTVLPPETFVGNWCGRWSSGRDSELLVKEVSGGKAKAVYVWGGGPSDRMSVKASVEGSKLVFKFRGRFFATVTYTLLSKDRIRGAWDPGGGATATINSTRC